MSSTNFFYVVWSYFLEAKVDVAESFFARIGYVRICGVLEPILISQCCVYCFFKVESHFPMLQGELGGVVVEQKRSDGLVPSERPVARRAAKENLIPMSRNL